MNLAGRNIRAGKLFRLLRSDWIITMKAYLDESTDSKQSEVFSVAGWIGAEEAWQQFSLDWRGRTHGLPVFHMTEVETNSNSFSENGWAKKQCIELITDLVTVIARRNLYGFGCGVLIPDFKSVFPHESLDSMYLLCFRHCVYSLSKLSPDPVEFVFDINKRLQLKAHSLYSRLTEIAGEGWKDKLGTIGFGSRSEYTPLQAADLIAYETFKKIRNANYYQSVPERKSIARLADTRRIAMVAYEKEALEDIRREMVAAKTESLWDYLAVDYPNAPSTQEAARA
jgi:hypothetical protein